MANSNDGCTLLVAVPPKQALPTVAELCAELEAPEPARKTAALQVRARGRVARCALPATKNSAALTRALA